jgi:hypothetical protein
VSIISLAQLKRKVRWQNITFEKATESYDGGQYSVCVFKLLPNDASWPTINLYFDGEVTCLDPLGFSHWHAHYDSWGDERRNLIDALRAVRALVLGNVCLVEELDGDAKYRGSSILPPNELPRTLGKDVHSLRRVFFNRPPIHEEIDFSKYWVGKHLLVEWSEKKEMEKICEENDIPNPYH